VQVVVVRMQTMMKLDEYHSSRCAPSILIILTIIASFGGLLFGYDTGVVGGALPLIAKDLALNDDQQQWVVSSAVGGAIIGSSISGVLMDNVGRKRVALLSSVIFVLGAIVLSSSDGFQSLLLGMNSHQHHQHHHQRHQHQYHQHHQHHHQLHHQHHQHHQLLLIVIILR